jgi:hypothetical protein
MVNVLSLMITNKMFIIELKCITNQRALEASFMFISRQLVRKFTKMLRIIPIIKKLSNNKSLI